MKKGKIFIPEDYSNPANLRIKTEVCIIGSGSAGSVVSKLLSGKGVKVSVIEEGRYVKPSSFNQRENVMTPLLYRENGNQMTKNFQISVLQGRCVGGSPVVNMADCVPLRKEVYNHWVKEFGFEGPDFDEIDRANSEIEKRLGVNKIDEKGELLNKNNKYLFESARSLGFSANTFRHNRVGCIGCGYCLIGCHYNAKQSTLITFLKDAVENGADIYSRLRVEKLIFRGDKINKAVGDVLDASTEKTIGHFEIEAEKFVLAAGAIHSPHIVLKSGIVRDGIGENLSLQPQAPVLAIFEEEMMSFRGIPQSVVIDEFEEISEKNGLGGFRIEGVMAGPAMSSYFAPSSGILFKNLMSNYSKIGAALVLFPDKPLGYITGKDRAPIPHYELSDDFVKRVRAGLKMTAQVYLKAGAKEVAFSFENYFPIRKKGDLKEIDNLEIKPAYFKMVSAHPQGTLRMSKKGPVDRNFRLKNFKNLYVCDASIFPTTSSSHTMLPIMSFSYTAAHRILKG